NSFIRYLSQHPVDVASRMHPLELFAGCEGSSSALEGRKLLCLQRLEHGVQAGRTFRMKGTHVVVETCFVGKQQSGHQFLREGGVPSKGLSQSSDWPAGSSPATNGAPK